jgi:hypothetical protein
MACFRPRDASNYERPDWSMLRNGPVTKFHSRDVLDRTRTWLRAEGYREIDMDARPWGNADDLIASVRTAFSLPESTGRGFDALDDLMYDFVEGAYGADPKAEATAIVVLGFDAFARAAPDAAHVFLHILARHVPRALMHGHRLLVLVQSDDPRLEIAAVGGHEPRWNDAEWLDAKRGL